MMTSIRAEIRNQLRVARESRSMSQSDLARRAEISRQALGAIESGTYAPGVGVALALARELGLSVEELFRGGSDGRIEAFVPTSSNRKFAAGARVALARVNGRTVAVAPPPAAFGLATADGVVDRTRGSRVSVEAYRSRAEIDSTVVVAGCDPAVSLVADWFSRRRAPSTVTPLPCSSREALRALSGGWAHVAGVHLRDPRTGDFNLGPVRRAVGHSRILLVNFARWEIGLAVASGNPLGIKSVEAIARPNIRLINRETGSGARMALDDAVRAVGLSAQKIDGYGREARGHLEVAGEIAAGRADLGVTIRVAALAYGLDFVPIRSERYDMVILERELETAPVQALMEALTSTAFAREVGSLCHYDTHEMGNIVAREG
jgi:molybdate-binding protein/DNA-binding XRE family transcriptional regulator